MFTLIQIFNHLKLISTTRLNQAEFSNYNHTKYMQCVINQPSCFMGKEKMRNIIINFLN